MIEKPKKKWLVARIAVAQLLVVLVTFGAGYSIGGGQLPLALNQNEPVATGLPDDLDYQSVEQVYDSLRSNYDGQLNLGDLLDGLKEGLVAASGDPYTEYQNAKDAEEFKNDLDGTFTGIGAELSKDEQTIVVVAPLAGFPADKAGLRPQDAIVEIDGESAFDISVSEAVKRIRGEAGTKVKLKIIRDQKQTLNFEITRQKITLPSVESEILDGNIGYMKISRFGEDTAALSRQAADKFKAAGVKGVILDLRNNPGGLVGAAVDLSSVWLERGKPVLEQKRAGMTIKRFDATGSPILNGIPTVVLINEGSASASEITAGALRDNGVARLVGQKTFGKGSVQQLVNLSDHGVLKVTIARWYTPSGKNIDKEGIEPDTKVARTEDDYKNNRDPQLAAALKFFK